MKPIWYLDVDGVINMVRLGRPADVPADCFRNEVVGKYRILWDTRVVDFINTMHREGKVEIVWLTTWEQAAVEVLTPGLQFDEFRLPSKSFRLEYVEGAYGWWKWESIWHHHDEDLLGERAVIWTDDDLQYSMRLQRPEPGRPTIQRWVDTRAIGGLSTLGISPLTERGLTMDHLDAIREVFDA